MVAFGAAVLRVLANFRQTWPVFAGILPEGHKYEQLLVNCVLILVVGFAAVLAGARRA
ncbi:MAG: hypothetical protein ABJF86_13680 [Tateyamaria sp.]|uniref:hypothetical protein n=1 Tax=Tateyamaria sp. TaxID=1929288 RepID=UPI003291508C